MTKWRIAPFQGQRMSLTDSPSLNLVGVHVFSAILKQSRKTGINVDDPDPMWKVKICLILRAHGKWSEDTSRIMV